MEDARPFDITILGATGCTAPICAQHIARTLPTNFRWCIAGRSPSKLKILAADPDHAAPSIRVVPDLSLEPLARRTTVLRTPSTLGMPFVERLRKAGVRIYIEKLARPHSKWKYPGNNVNGCVKNSLRNLT
ncbi:hypothetical protein F4775DRAFT_589751 [Biscogniauxia sp. FL1348]|nr:hypothetical protein F4775DRAFT_589751 [Biscogniauxia sp. FL1348]